MTFEDFARIHGLIINHVIPYKEVRTSTQEHPHKKNGSYKFLGDKGFVMNWATMDKPATWFPDKNTPITIKKISQVEANKERKELAEQAKKKAEWIMGQVTQDTHPYLAAKGFPNMQSYVWNKNGEKLLVIPMRSYSSLVGLQLIDAQGNKKFLYGQSSKGAVFTFNAKGFPIFCEGYATALSVREVLLKTSNIKYSIYTCFSASNMKFVARKFRKGIIIADNDRNGIGEKTAIEANKPYWIASTIGYDFNDYHMEVGTEKASQELKKLIQTI
jgi:putative DNA primase/helicase